MDVQGIIHSKNVQSREKGGLGITQLRIIGSTLKSFYYQFLRDVQNDQINTSFISFIISFFAVPDACSDAHILTICDIGCTKLHYVLTMDLQAIIHSKNVQSRDKHVFGITKLRIGGPIQKFI